MASRTSGGLLKFSIAVDDETVAFLNRSAEARKVSRADIVRELIRIASPVYEQQQRVLQAMAPAQQAS